MDLQNKKVMPRSVTSIVDEGFFYIREYVDRNLVLETVFERIVVGNHYCDNPMGGLLVLRAENIILIGELDPCLPQLPPHITSLPLPQILTARKAERDSLVLKRNLKAWIEELLEDM
uniref:Sm-like protein LSM1B n=1 Tax=Cucumis melo TaxID=3656 RepID=A0A9I9EA07_CUCME